MAKLELSQQKLNTVKKAEEYYNALRTNVQLSGNNLKVIAVTSVDPSEGKSTTSTNIAWAFARAGYKTLLVDADIRNSVMSGVFKSRERITGLTDYLAGTQDLSNGLCETNVDNLFVIESGVASPNPTALLQSDNFEIMIETLRKYFDYIIVDTAPIGVVIDAAIVVQKCDASILVVEAGVAKRREVQKAKSQLEQTGKPSFSINLIFNVKNMALTVVMVIMVKDKMRLGSPYRRTGVLQYNYGNLIECTCWFASLYTDCNFRDRYFFKLNIRSVWKNN